MLKKSKCLFFVAMAVFAVVGFGGSVFGVEESANVNANTKLFLAVIKVKDERRGSPVPSLEDIQKRFALELDNPASVKQSSKEPVDGGIAQIIGEIDSKTTFRVTYTYPSGKKVDVVRNMIAWRAGTYPLFSFSPPVKEGDDSGPKNVFNVALKVYDDPDPQFTGSVQDGLLEVTVVQ